jgi:hypothetical protein
MAKRTVKPTKEPHYGHSAPPKSFNGVYAGTVGKPKSKTKHKTARNATPFFVSAQLVTRGPRRGKEVLIFRSVDGVERARTYSCCWKHKTNCIRQWIDCYTRAL